MNRRAKAIFWKNKREEVREKISKLSEEARLYSDKLLQTCPHDKQDREEWDDLLGNIFTECKLCGWAEVIGEVKTEERRVYYANNSKE